jgi:hypothetical protein
MGLLYGRTGRLNPKNADFRPAQCEAFDEFPRPELLASSDECAAPYAAD